MNEKSQAKKPQMRVACYCRVATANQLSESAVEIQQRWLEAIIREHENWTITNSYVDVGANRMKASERPSFKKMLQDCKSGSVDLILTRDLYRLSRNTQEYVQIIRQLHDMGIGVYFEEGQNQSVETVNRIGYCCMNALQNQ